MLPLLFKEDERQKDEARDRLAVIHPALKLKISPRARRIALRLDNTTHTMNLVVPKRFSMKKAEAFAWQHRDWIHEKLAALPAPIRFSHGSVIPVLGRNRTLDIIYNPALKITNIQLDDDRIIVNTNQQDPAARITRYLKREARDALSELAKEKAARINKQISAIQVRDTKSRWGSCGPDGRISFSWRLVFAPWEAMDYVVAHEVAHLVHMNHGKRFWALCEKLCEDYDTGKTWMRANGNELTRYS